MLVTRSDLFTTDTEVSKFPYCEKTNNSSPSNVSTITLYSMDTNFDASTQTTFENIVGKEEIAR